MLLYKKPCNHIKTKTAIIIIGLFWGADKFLLFVLFSGWEWQKKLFGYGFGSKYSGYMLISLIFLLVWYDPHWRPCPGAGWDADSKNVLHILNNWIWGHPCSLSLRKPRPFLTFLAFHWWMTCVYIPLVNCCHNY